MTDPTQPTEDFASLLAATADAKRPEIGADVKGTVVQIGDADILVDVGGKSEALIARAELAADDGTLSVKVGDVIEAKVVATEGGLRLSRRVLASSKNRGAVSEMLKDAHHNRMPVQGRVTASVKGGYEVQVAGMRGFCPFSQIDVRRQEDPTLYFNKTFDFLIKEYDPRKRNLILSRRALIDAEGKKKEAEARSKINGGSILPGTVVSIQDFGAFLDLGDGVQGLLHVSEISRSRVSKPSEILTVGQKMDVQVLRVDQKTGKISLTRKPFEEDPWAGVTERFHQGQIHGAKVVRVTEFGAFVELAPGVDGLVHVSELGGGRGGKKTQDFVKVGEEIKVQVLKVEEARRRISLGLASETVKVGAKVAVVATKVGDVVTGKVERVERFGVFIRIGPGSTGLIPTKELGTPRGADHRKMFPVGTELKAEVIEADPAGRKIRLSVTKAEGREEREALDRYKK
ncbi:MAG TPA: S1 RNA-binding domain-containing protein, partial [Candidatus Polarisedimenticolia bacterium]|nr:S1 RNA-binding domain-containing protein [Candidatus Polarisedimenticolia bacterium]